MRFLLISANREKRYPYPVMPIGAGQVCETIRRYGHFIRMIDVCFEEEWECYIEETIKKDKYDMLLFSLRNIDNCLFPNTDEYITYYKQLVEFCRTKTNVPFLAGGIAVRMMGQQLIDELGVEYGYIGPACENMVLGIEEIINNSGRTGEYGFVYRDVKLYEQTNGIKGYRKNEPPRFEAYQNINIKKYTSHGGNIGFQTKYGCNLGCIYCSYPIIEGKEIVCYEPKAVAKLIKDVTNSYKLNFFEFTDSTFNHPISQAKEICKSIIEEKLNLSWTAFFSPLFVDEELVKLCKEAGCVGIDLGIDSASDTMLMNLRKGFSQKHIASACELFRKYNIPVCFNLLLGGPGENKKTLSETFEFLNQFPECPVSAYSGIRVYPGTAIECIARKEKQVEGSLLYPQFYISKEIENELEEILKRQRKEHPHWMLRGFTKPPSEAVIERFQKERSSPLWTEKFEGMLKRKQK